MDTSKRILLRLIFTFFYLAFTLPTALALTISNATTVNVTQSETDKLVTFVAEPRNANINALQITNILEFKSVKIVENNDDVIISNNTSLQLGSSVTDLIINAANNIRIGTNVHIEGYGNLILRANSAGNNNGTLIPPSDNSSSITPIYSKVKVFYRAEDFTKPADFSNLITGNFQAFMLINNLQDLQNINKNLQGYYALATNIDASIAEFKPIGNFDQRFTGIFDGQGYQINNLKINQPTMNYVGLFGYLNSIDSFDGIIQNLQLINVNIVGNNRVGGLVGEAYRLRGEGHIHNIHVSGNVSGKYDVGLLSGGGNYPVSNCFTEGTVAAVDSAGGLLGAIGGNTIRDCFSTANVIRIGGEELFYGFGGLFGYVYGLALFNSFSIGSVVSTPNSGGISGRTLLFPIQWENVIWNIQTTGQTKPAGNMDQIGDTRGLTTFQMQQKETYKEWNFVNTWGINENPGSYPYFLWTKQLAPWTTIDYMIVGD